MPEAKSMLYKLGQPVVVEYAKVTFCAEALKHAVADVFVKVIVGLFGKVYFTLTNPSPPLPPS